MKILMVSWEYPPVVVGGYSHDTIKTFIAAASC